MSIIHAEYAEILNARPEDVYTLLADYVESHPKILPPQFKNVTVTQGGRGAGTVFNTTVQVIGTTKSFTMHVTEPEPGRRLVETDVAQGVTTTFNIEPTDAGRKTRLTIATDSQASPGFAGFMEKLMIPPVQRRMYKQEMKLIAGYLAAHSKTSAAV
jgi:Polyketide cyclase / dehydrase and lipid transport